MADVAIITAIYGEKYDSLSAICPQNDINEEWIVVTDDPDIKDGHGWRVIYDPKPGMHPTRAAHLPKAQPWLYTDCPASIWIDASITVRQPRFARAVVNHADPICQFTHGLRDCIYDEANFAWGMRKYINEPMLAQAEHYRVSGHPEHWGLWWGAVIGRKHTEEIKRFGEAWTQEMTNWSCLDQVSEPFVLRNLGINMVELPGHIYWNSWIVWKNGVTESRRAGWDWVAGESR